MKVTYWKGNFLHKGQNILSQNSKGTIKLNGKLKSERKWMIVISQVTVHLFKSVVRCSKLTTDEVMENVNCIKSKVSFNTFLHFHFLKMNATFLLPVNLPSQKIYIYRRWKNRWSFITNIWNRNAIKHSSNWTKIHEVTAKAYWRKQKFLRLAMFRKYSNTMVFYRNPVHIAFSRTFYCGLLNAVLDLKILHAM